MVGQYHRTRPEGEKNMEFKLFVDQPSLDLHKGIQVTKDTEATFENENVEQVIKNLTLETIMNEEGDNGLNSYKSKSYISIKLNEGDILIFSPERGYYLPPYPKTTIEQAAKDLESMIGTKLSEETAETQ